MAKELPYFRFTASEWLNDDISLESYDIKGLFADVCAYYWFKDCSITLAMLNKRFSNAKILLDELLNLDIIKSESEEDYISIKFLDEQYDLLSEKRRKRSEAGRIGGLKKSSNAKAMLKQCSSYKDKDKDKDKDINGNNKFKIPLIEDVKKYFVDNGYKESVGEEAFHYYNVAGWKDSKGNKVKNWKQKMRGVWFKDENKIQSNKPKLSF